MEQIETTIIISFLTALITALFTFLIQERRFWREFKLDIKGQRTEYMTEKAIKNLLKNKNGGKRTFKEIKKKVGVFEENELRKILVRIGAVRFLTKDEDLDTDQELWGLLKINKNL